MRLRWRDVLSLTLVLAVLWSLAQGRPGPACNAERPNAQDTTGRLKNCLEHLLKMLQDVGYTAGGKRIQDCLPMSSKASNKATQLDTISSQLCQYNACWKHLANSSWMTKHLSPAFPKKMRDCQDHISNLRDTIIKMKEPRAAPYLPPCKGTLSSSGGWWKVSMVPQLSQELLEYLKQLQFPCG